MPVEPKDKVTKEGIAKAAASLKKAIQKEKERDARAHMVESHSMPEKRKHEGFDIAAEAALEAKGRLEDRHLGISKSAYSDRLINQKRGPKVDSKLLEIEKKRRHTKDKMKLVHAEVKETHAQKQRDKDRLDAMSYSKPRTRLHHELKEAVARKELHKELKKSVEIRNEFRKNLLSKIDKIEAVLAMVLDGVPELESYVEECKRELSSVRVSVETEASGLKTHLHKLLDMSAKKLNSIDKPHASKTYFGNLVRLFHELLNSFCALFSNKKPAKETMFRPSSHEVAKYQLRGFNDALESIYGEIHELTVDKENRHSNKHQ